MSSLCTNMMFMLITEAMCIVESCSMFRTIDPDTFSTAWYKTELAQLGKTVKGVQQCMMATSQSTLCMYSAHHLILLIAILVSDNKQ